MQLNTSHKAVARLRFQIIKSNVLFTRIPLPYSGSNRLIDMYSAPLHSVPDKTKNELTRMSIFDYKAIIFFLNGATHSRASFKNINFVVGRCEVLPEVN
jgi:hypothetical protein